MTDPISTPDKANKSKQEICQHLLEGVCALTSVWRGVSKRQFHLDDDP